jgi:hypothetical protein
MEFFFTGEFCFMGEFSRIVQSSTSVQLTPQAPLQHAPSAHDGADSELQLPAELPFMLKLGAEMRRTCAIESQFGQTTSSFTSRTL